MKPSFLFLLTFFICFQITAQYDQLGQDIFDENSFTGASVSMDNSGGRVAVLSQMGDTQHEIKVYDIIDNQWFQIGNSIFGTYDGNQNNFRGSVNLSGDGQRILVSSPFFKIGDEFSGKGEVFELLNDAWIRVGGEILGETPVKNFSYGNSINDKGDTVILGSWFDFTSSIPSYASVHKLIDDEWIQIGQPIVGDGNRDYTGTSTSINALGNIIAVGSPRFGQEDVGTDGRGRVRVFSLINDQWEQLGDDIRGEGKTVVFGGLRVSQDGIVLNDEGDIISILSPGFVDAAINERIPGYIISFKFEDNNWVKLGATITLNDTENPVISLNSAGDILAIGTRFDNPEVFIYAFENNDWVRQDQVLNGSEMSSFGFSLAMNSEGNNIIVGAIGSDDNTGNSGFARVFGENPSLSTTNFEINDAFSVYPNPSNGNFSIVLPEATTSGMFTLSNILGKQFLSKSFSNKQQIDINENLSTGLYLVKVSSDNGVFTTKIMIE